jgi:hypothetical protein
MELPIGACNTSLATVVGVVLTVMRYPVLGAPGLIAASLDEFPNMLRVLGARLERIGLTGGTLKERVLQHPHWDPAWTTGR